MNRPRLLQSGNDRQEAAADGHGSRRTNRADLRSLVVAALLLLPLLTVTGTAQQGETILAPSSIALINHPTPLLELSDFHRSEDDKCGPINEKLAEQMRLLSEGWGYDYEELIEDIVEWKKSPYVSVTSIGKTVQHRDIWELTITSNEPGVERRHRIAIHARTHPHEIQSWWVADNMIRYLLSDDPFARLLRKECIFHIIPMYNPDGVEMETTRYNANGVDLEREWDKPDPEPEAAALKARYAQWMNSSQPIEVMLNLHSASDPQRYFWFHDPTGTSEEYATLEREFINDARGYFSRISPWDYRVSWINETPTHFPESWFWMNYGTSVMALTYEEIFSNSLTSPTGYFDSAAYALLNGIIDYLDIVPSSVAISPDGRPGDLLVTGSSLPELSMTLEHPGTLRVELYNSLGQRLAEEEEYRTAGPIHIRPVDEPLPPGLYVLQVIQGDQRIVKKLLVQGE